MNILILTILLFFIPPLSVYSHSGRTNADGCHTNKTKGDYHCHNKMKRSSSPNATTSSLLPSESHNLLGRWCWAMGSTEYSYAIGDTNALIKLYISENEVPRAEVKYFDGSKSNRQLTDLGHGLFEINKNKFGEKYHILPNNGDLRMLDNNGLIGTAKRLGDSPNKGECLKE